MLSALLLQVMCQPPASPIMPQLSPWHQLCLPVPLSMCKLSTGVAYYPVRFPLFPAKKSQKQIQIQIKIHIYTSTDTLIHVQIYQLAWPIIPSALLIFLQRIHKNKY